MQKINVFKIPMSAPDDLTEFKKLVDEKQIIANDIIAVLGKTEGNGCVNDFTRALSTTVLKSYLAKELNLEENDVLHKVAFVMSGGTEGVMAPHATVFTKSDVATKRREGKYLVASSGYTRDFLPEEIGTVVMVQEVARVVKELMKDAGLDSTDDVHFVQIKCPLLTSDRIQDAYDRGFDVVVTDTYKSMGYSRGASALGVAVALGEVESEKVTNEVICHDWSFYSSVASTSAGIELMNCEIILLGNSNNSASDLSVGHSVMKDAIDLEAIIEALDSAGMKVDKLPTKEQAKDIVNVLAKAEASTKGKVRGRRNTMLTDSDINHTRHARAVVNGVIAAVVGDPMVYVSGGGEHQGPDGGGPIAVIINKK
ncbi:MAG: ring-opening amidohydrolase [Acholeplasmataceae bacterium]|nr:ring-opening amidohydrolase [Acholeplasmataceae bacterium]